ncbi:MAG: phosphopantetheine-binding protein [Prevotella sp.]|jgi:acyl carrier protein|nr:phosphopantetheine-binding protein [Prevotella sp.]
MTRKEIEDKVRAFLIDDLEIDEDKIKDDAQLKADLGIDSLDLVDIVVIVEKNFGFKIKPEEMKEVVTLKDFCDYIERKVNK